MLGALRVKYRGNGDRKFGRIPRGLSIYELLSGEGNEGKGTWEPPERNIYRYRCMKPFKKRSLLLMTYETPSCEFLCVSFCEAFFTIHEIQKILTMAIFSRRVKYLKSRTMRLFHDIV